MTPKNWLLGCPPPCFGSVAEGFYNCGPMSADERPGPTEEDSRMQIVTDVTKADFESYVAGLKNSGVRFYLERNLGYDAFFAFLLEGKNYHLRFCSKRRELRVIEEPESVALPDFGYSLRGDRQTVLYQYGLYYDPDNNMTERTANCGMLYIFRLSDNSLFMMDGGYHLQWREEAMDRLWQFLQEITNTPEGEKVRISCWYFTHTHADHIDGCVKLLNLHHEDILLERLMFNFPRFDQVPGYEPAGYQVKEQVAKWYPQAKYLKLHTGQKFSLADMDIEVFYTQEDGVVPENITCFPMLDRNCMSSVLKVTIDGQTVMLLADTNVETEDWLRENADPGIWKADMVQLAHHCFNYLDTLYQWIEAPMILVPNSYGGAHQPENTPKLEGALKYMSADQIWYEGGGTDGIAVVDGRWQHVYHGELVGGPYDFSGQGF